MTLALMTLLVGLECPRDGPQRAVRPSAPRDESESQSGFDDESVWPRRGAGPHHPDDDSPQTTKCDARRASSRTEEITKRDD